VKIPVRQVVLAQTSAGMNFLVVKTIPMEAPFFVRKGNRISTFLSVNHGWCWTVRAEALPYIKKVG
jgi:hypothetical protein